MAEDKHPVKIININIHFGVTRKGMETIQAKLQAVATIVDTLLLHIFDHIIALPGNPSITTFSVMDYEPSVYMIEREDNGKNSS